MACGHNITISIVHSGSLIYYSKTLSYGEQEYGPSLSKVDLIGARIRAALSNYDSCPNMVWLVPGISLPWYCHRSLLIIAKQAIIHYCP